MEDMNFDEWENEPEVPSEGYNNIPQSLLIPYSLIEINEIEKSMYVCIRNIKELFATSEDNAITLLKMYKWNEDKLQQDYFANDKAVLQKCGLVPDPSVGTQKGSQTDCLICFTSLAGRPVDKLSCGHVFCSDCWSMYVTAAVKSGKDCVLTRCPLVGCPIIVPKSIFDKYLSESQRHDYIKHVCKSYTDENKAMRWCPAPGCTFLALNESLVQVDITCKCGHVFCFSCGEESHLPCTCELTKKWKIKSCSESENVLWIMANTKSCPKCQKPIEKNQGCNHMTCSECRHEFCWICMGDWKIHGEKTGGYYKCNRYDEDIKSNKGLKDMETKQKEAKTELARYTFYYERYNNHDKAMAIAIKQLGEVDDKIMGLNKARNFPLMELQFLREAAMALIGVRRVLKNSYAYGYYIINPKEKLIFEDLQGNLENNCDHLHQLLEKDLSVYAKENIVDDSPFFNYKSELVNYFEITKNFFRNFCEGVKSGLAEGNI
eukprot:TRINITY_DN1898_c0_g3_i1.p2 TRINITY_DN1898_c0_g3~~TRINITY_DN1898_c0_g3_i1.p2  ORF type:complete len:490 (-),score=172.28 TRINITY_DN1898_c0_g3_i1:96-1565(-)